MLIQGRELGNEALWEGDSGRPIISLPLKKTVRSITAIDGRYGWLSTDICESAFTIHWRNA